MRFLIAVALICALLAGTAGLASASFDNLLVNGDFSTNFKLAGSAWNYYGAVAWDRYNGQPCGSAVVPEYAWALLTQQVKVADCDWLASGIKLQYELKAKLRIYPSEDIHFKLGWWDSLAAAPSATSKPDHVITLGHFTNTNQQWIDACYEGTLDCQPRWLSVRVEWNPELNQPADCHGWVDQLEFRAKCLPDDTCPPIPEPMSAVLGCMGMAMLAGVRRIRRK